MDYKQIGKHNLIEGYTLLSAKSSLSKSEQIMTAEYEKSLQTNFAEIYRYFQGINVVKTQ